MLQLWSEEWGEKGKLRKLESRDFVTDEEGCIDACANEYFDVDFGVCYILYLTQWDNNLV